MKKILGFALLIALLFTVSVGATETDIETPTDITSPEELIGAVIDFIPEIKETTESDLDGVIVGAAEISVAVESGEIPSPTDVAELVNKITAYLASLEIKEDASGIGTYIKEEIVPLIVIIITGALTIYGMVYPIIVKTVKVRKKVEEAAKQFSGAAADVKEAIAEKKAVTEMQGEITAMKETSANMLNTIKELKAENEALKTEVKQLVVPVSNELSHISSAIKIGLCNTQELVNNGYAAKIIKELDGGENVQVEDEVNTH